MRFRDVVIFSGHRFSVPQGIQRIDTRATHGWQVRYGGTRLFSDHTSDGSGAVESLRLAMRDLVRRIATLPAPSQLQKRPSSGKTSDLPVGISGPVVRQREGSRVRSCSLSVLLPRFGKVPRCSSVYIGTENTYTVERYQAALAKAVELRRAAEARYEADATRARRADAKVLKAVLAQAAPKAAQKGTQKAAPRRAAASKASRG